MSLLRYQGVISRSACCATMCQLFSGCLLCRKYMKQGSTKNDSSFPYVVGFVSSSLWMCYGVLTENETLIVMNLIGCSLFLTYIFVFYFYTTFKEAGSLKLIQRSKYLVTDPSYMLVSVRNTVRKQLFFTLVAVGSLLTYVRLETDRNLLKARIGFVSSLVGVSFCASPLSTALHVIRTKDAESLPVPMITMTAIVTFLWYLYGVCLGDTFIIYPNLVGFLLSAIQVVLYLTYARKESLPVYSVM